MAQRILDAPFGPLVVTTTDVGVREIWFGRDARVDVGDVGSAAAAHIDRAEVELREYLAGQRTVFEVPLDRTSRTGFRGEVLDALEQVRFGETVTYGELADRTGRPKASRAVGTAMATNPIAIIVPCHRVLPSTGGVGNYAGTPAVKEFLLRLEGVALD